MYDGLDDLQVERDLEWESRIAAERAPKLN